MRIEVKQGKRGQWRWIVRGADGKAVFLAPVNTGHDRPELAVGEARMALRDVAFETRPRRWFDWFPTRDLKAIERESMKVPVDVVPHEAGSK